MEVQIHPILAEISKDVAFLQFFKYEICYNNHITKDVDNIADFTFTATKTC
jgi:hypothetical protein